MKEYEAAAILQGEGFDDAAIKFALHEVTRGPLAPGRLIKRRVELLRWERKLENETEYRLWDIEWIGCKSGWKDLPDDVTVWLGGHVSRDNSEEVEHSLDEWLRDCFGLGASYTYAPTGRTRPRQD